MWIPSQENTPILESTKSIESAPGVKFLKREADRTIYAVESGEYRFEST